MAKKPTAKRDPLSGNIAQNRRARHDYEIVDTLECGIMLHGSEVKSLRDGKISLEESYASVQDGEVWLHGANIAEYPQANLRNHVPERKRKLLLHKREIRKFADVARQDGLTLVPLAMYFSRGIAKVELAIAKGRKTYDKREVLKRKTADREMRAAMSPKRNYER